MTFAEQLLPHAERLGAVRVAEICRVTPRSIRLWLRGEGNPNYCTQAGALLLLSRVMTPAATASQSVR